MSGRAHAAIAADRRRVQRSAVRAGLWVGGASAAILTIITVVSIAALIATSRPDRRPPRPGDGDELGRVVDLDDALPIAIALGVIGVIALGVIAWYVARRAAAPLAEALEVQRAFVADASHELRTPLTTLTSRIQLAEHRAERGGDVTGALRDLRRDAAVLDDVLTDLLTAAEAAGSRAQDTAAWVDVVDAIEDATDIIRPVAEAGGIRIEQDAPRGLIAAADRRALRRALVALLDNAVRYAPATTAVRIDARRAGQTIELRVRDHGPGIRGIDPDRLFERFARAADTRERPGFGLGLALVRDVAMRFGGSVEVEETSAAGTTFLLTLPLGRATREAPD
ncbi:sensor histidine kinase KdpD [Microbacterium sp. SLBN-146]|uniref:sensor histidine kinase n=1 Tax=Microbacterium sp. SLBN-146 TaxID=2768457 RepID=UPI001150BC24|nr:HAMP domain-containing sensor histidine kinase [Microbacterium sp. SLBN-146]TQJ30964.1 phospho-acceptor domain-containing protein [Microbacterium sp. SLBN-146]